MEPSRKRRDRHGFRKGWKGFRTFAVCRTMRVEHNPEGIADTAGSIENNRVVAASEG